MNTKEKIFKRWILQVKLANLNAINLRMLLFCCGIILPFSMLYIRWPRPTIYMLVIILVYLAVFVLFQKKRIIDTLHDQRVFVPAPESTLNLILPSLDEFSQKTSFENKVKVLIEKSDPTISALVLSYGRTDYLVLSLGFLSFLRKYPLPAKAVLAHEFSHMIRGDARRWVSLSVLSKQTRSVLFPIVIVVLFTTVISFPISMVSGIIIAWDFALAIYFLFYFLPWIRREIEAAADIGAMILTKPDYLIEALGIIGTEDHSNSDKFNPSKIWRQNRIAKFLENNPSLLVP